MEAKTRKYFSSNRVKILMTAGESLSSKICLFLYDLRESILLPNCGGVEPPPPPKKRRHMYIHVKCSLLVCDLTEFKMFLQTLVLSPQHQIL